MIKKSFLVVLLLPCFFSVCVAQKQNIVNNLFKKSYIDSLRVVIVGEKSNSVNREFFMHQDTVRFKIIRIKKTGLSSIDTLPIADNLKLKAFSISGALYTKNTRVGDHIDAEYRITDLFITGSVKQRLFNEFYATYGFTIMNCDLIDDTGTVYKLEDRRIDLKIE